MDISIVVPAYNEEKLIATSLRHIGDANRGFTKRGWKTEVIVCDNNSNDRTAELARAEGAKVVFEPVNQIARSRNRGAQAAQGKWLVFIDADSRPSRELFEDVAECILDGRCLAGGCTVKLDEPHFLGGLLTRTWNVISRVRKWAAGSFIFCETAAFREIGGFSEELFASEEIDLCKRLKKLARTKGKRLVILHRNPILTSARKIHLYSRGEYLRFMAKAVLQPRRTLRSRELCVPWYDGRR